MPTILRVLEHSILTVGYAQGEGAARVMFEETHWHELLRFHDTGAGRRYYDIRHQGVRFKHYVGVLQVGGLTIEVLPKADAEPGRATPPGEDFDRWRQLLMQMLTEAGLLPVDTFRTALLQERENSLLDLYLGLFLTEVETLLRRGLVKRYHQREGQVKALKGTLLFGQHLARNVVHQERFFTRHQTYDHDHLPHRLLRQALVLLPVLTTAPSLRGRAARALLAWPELPAIHPTPATFARLRYDRKTAPYRTVLRIARLLLLRLSPDVRSGAQDMVALFFNMNHIWEVYLLRTIQRLAPAGWTVHKPSKVVFWQDAQGYQSRMQPDILLQHATQGTIVLDAKWKRPHGKPAEVDLRQLFAYAQYFEATRARLLYPQTGAEQSVEGVFTRALFGAEGAEAQVIQCGVSYIQVGQAALGYVNLSASDINQTTGYLACSLETVLLAWLS